MSGTSMRARVVGIATMLCLVGAPALVSAQAASQPPSADDRRQAADAFDRGTSAMLSRDYAAAAHWFEQANRLAPTPPALMQAIRANERAGNSQRVANLALRLRDLYPDDAQARSMSNDILGRVSGQYVEVRVHCSAACALDHDGTLQEHPAFFVAPDRDIHVNATFPGGTLTQTVHSPAGSVQSLEFEAPPPPPEPEPGAEPLGGGGSTAPAADEHHGMPRAVFWTSLGVTAALGGVLAWSAADMYGGVSDYEAAAAAGASNAQSLYDQGHSAEIRTDILIGCTAAAAVATTVIGIFTDWKREPDASSQRVGASVGLSPQGGSLLLQGRF